MSILKLQKVRDEVIKAEIGLHLEVTQKLIGAIDEHVADTKPDVHQVDEDLKEQAKNLQAKVDDLASQLAAFKAEKVAEVKHVTEEAVDAIGEAAGEALDNRQ